MASRHENNFDGVLQPTETQIKAVGQLLNWSIEAVSAVDDAEQKAPPLSVPENPATGNFWQFMIQGNNALIDSNGLVRQQDVRLTKLESSSDTDTDEFRLVSLRSDNETESEADIYRIAYKKDSDEFVAIARAVVTRVEIEEYTAERDAPLGEHEAFEQERTAAGELDDLEDDLLEFVEEEIENNAEGLLQYFGCDQKEVVELLEILGRLVPFSLEVDEY